MLLFIRFTLIEIVLIYLTKSNGLLKHAFSSDVSFRSITTQHYVNTNSPHRILLCKIRKPSADGAAGSEPDQLFINKKIFLYENKLNSRKKRNKRKRIVLLTMEPIEESKAQVGDMFQSKKWMQCIILHPMVYKFAVIIYFYCIFRTFQNHQCHVITILSCNPTLCQHLTVKYRGTTTC